MSLRGWLALVLLVVAPEAAHAAQLHFPGTDSTDLRRFADTLAARFASRVAEVGYPLPSVPRVMLAERAVGDPRRQREDVPSFLAAGSFPLLNQISLPVWSAVQSSERQDFEVFAAPVGTEKLFSVFWSWLAPAHELSHLVQGRWGNGFLSIADLEDRTFEMEAWALAIAFYREEGAGEELAEAASQLSEAIVSTRGLLPSDTTGWSPASSPEAVALCTSWVQRRSAASGPTPETYALRWTCPYRAILDLLQRRNAPDFATLVGDIAGANDPARWPRSCAAAADLLARHPEARLELERVSSDELTPAYTSWRFGSAAGGLGLTLGNEELAASCGAGSGAAPADALHGIVVRAWQRLHPAR